MNNYKKPVVLLNEELSEGVYAASGSDCYTCSARITQKPATGMLNYVIQFDAKHLATADHHSTAQTLVITFNKPVDYVSSQGKLASGDGTSTLEINYNYHNNAPDNIGLGDLKVMPVDGSWDGLEVTNVYLVCNMECDQHSHLPNYP